MLTIDGSQGEGGGQILRTALGLSMLTGTPFRIERVRANRVKPGLMRQHLTAVLAAAEVCGADVDGAAVGSAALAFRPGPVRPGDYTFAVGTAGSTALVFQAVLPALLTAAGPTTLALTGGTHNPFAPPFEFIQKAFLGVVNTMGPRVDVALDRHGFYPAGGGRWAASIAPAPALAPTVALADRGEPAGRCCTAVVAGLPGEIAVRELAVARRAFDWPEDSFRIRQLPDGQGPGNVVLAEVAHANVTEVFIAHGQRGTRAEAVAEQCLREVKQYLAGTAPVGPHLADQLLVPLAMAGGGSFVATELTEHARTNVEVIRAFLPVEVGTEEVGKGRWAVTVRRR